MAFRPTIPHWAPKPHQAAERMDGLKAGSAQHFAQHSDGWRKTSIRSIFTVIAIIIITERSIHRNTMPEQGKESRMQKWDWHIGAIWGHEAAQWQKEAKRNSSGEWIQKEARGRDEFLQKLTHWTRQRRRAYLFVSISSLINWDNVT